MATVYFESEMNIHRLYCELAYEIYKQDWVDGHNKMGKTEKELEEENEIYVCLDEFIDNEYNVCREYYRNRIKEIKL